MHHACLLPSIQPTYSYAWQAYKTARNIWRHADYHLHAIKKYALEDMTKPLIIDVAADEMLGNHYLEVFNIIRQRSENEDDPKKMEIVYDEIKAVVTDLIKVKDGIKTNESIENKKEYIGKIDSIISKFRNLVREKFSKLLAKDVSEKESVPETPDMPQMPPAAPPAQPPLTASRKKDNGMDNEVKDELMEEYGSKACQAIEKRHQGAIYRICKNGIEIVDSETSKSMLKISVNKNMMVDKIVSLGEISEIYPSNSFAFYQRYWKPVAENIGHFFVDDEKILLSAAKSSLPDIPKKLPSAFDLKGWDQDNSKEQNICMAFIGNEDDGNSTWVFSKCKKIKKDAGRVYTEDDFIQGSPKMVKCIDPALKTIFGKTGEVVSVIPLENHIELDINFGNKNIRLTVGQIEIINE